MWWKDTCTVWNALLTRVDSARSLLARFYTILKQKARVEDELATMKGSAPAKTGRDAPTKPGPSIPAVPLKTDPLERKRA